MQSPQPVSPGRTNTRANILHEFPTRPGGGPRPVGTTSNNYRGGEFQYLRRSKSSQLRRSPAFPRLPSNSSETIGLDPPRHPAFQDRPRPPPQRVGLLAIVET